MPSSSPYSHKRSDVAGRPGPAFADRHRRRAGWLVVVLVVLVLVLATMVWHSTHPAGIDSEAAEALYGRRGSAFRTLFNALTVLGSPAVALAGVLVGAGGVLYRLRDWRLAAFCPAALAAAVVAETVLKRLVDRARPPTAALLHVQGQSFPSGHATAAAALALSASLLVISVGGRWRRPAVALLTVYAVLIAVSRLVLGVHYFSDVVGGAALGSAVALAMALAWRWPQTDRRQD